MNRWVSLLVFCLLPGLAWAGPVFDRVQAPVEASFAARAQGGDLLLDEVLDAEAAVDRQAAEGDDLTRVKYLLSHWRQSTRDYLLETAPASEASFRAVVSQLNKLGALLDERALRALEHLSRVYPGAVDRVQVDGLILVHGDPKVAGRFLRPGSRLAPFL